MSEPPKLFTHKPKKAHIKQQGNVAKDSPPQPRSAVPPPPPPLSTPPPPATGKESFARRYKFLWPLLLTVNLTVGAYIFMRTKKKNTSGEEETTVAVVVSPADAVSPTTHPANEESAHSNAVAASPVSLQSSAVPGQTTPKITRVAVPEEQQRELFKWMLDEKRKIKPKNDEEKKRIDAEKDVLKQFIRAESIPIV